MYTTPAARAAEFRHGELLTVFNRRSLADAGFTWSRVEANIRATRWQRVGSAIVVHSGSLTIDEQCAVALLNCGPRAALTSFTALRSCGLQGWNRDGIHVVAPLGVSRPVVPELDIRMHWTRRPLARELIRDRSCHAPAPAVVLAASSLTSPRSACGVAVAAVQQRLISAVQLTQAIQAAVGARHRRALRAAAADVAMGSEALSEIDFVRLCRRAGLPEPSRQSVRTDSMGRRRYLDAVWDLADGRTLAVEVDGALHLAVSQWWSDQLRQNELTLAGSVVLRFPSVVIRTEPAVVIGQLQQALRQAVLRR